MEALANSDRIHPRMYDCTVLRSTDHPETKVTVDQIPSTIRPAFVRACCVPDVSSPSSAACPFHDRAQCIEGMEFGRHQRTGGASGRTLLVVRRQSQ